MKENVSLRTTLRQNKYFDRTLTGVQAQLDFVMSASFGSSKQPDHKTEVNCELEKQVKKSSK